MVWWLWVWFFVGCAKRPYEAAHAVEGYGTGYGGAADEDYAEESVVAAKSVPARSYTTADRPSGGPVAPPPPPPTSEPTVAPPEQPQARMVHYYGYAQLRVTDPEATLESLTKKADAAGGYVEQRSTDHITLRVPVAGFRAFYDDVLTLGDVIEKSLTAEDVTDAFQSTDLRLRTAVATRERLQALLAKAKEEEEKLRLLTEIRRLTEQIDSLDAQKQLLARLASLSRVTISVVARDAFVGAQERIEYEGFGWIGQLSPFRRDVQHTGKRVAIATPTGLVKLTDVNRFTAEGPEGAVVWASRHLNDPEGDAAFWIGAIETRLGKEFKEVTRYQLGSWQLIRMVEPVAESPYVYIVAVRVVGRHRDLVEMYFPDQEQETRYQEAIAQVLQGGVS
jgi:hypothetical protein